MRILIDTHLFLWWTNEDRHLSKKARLLIEQADEVYVSSASIWEAAIKIKLGKLEVNINSLINEISKSQFIELPMTAKHAAYVLELSDLHRDPFDRILVAQAMSEPLKFITSDKKLKDYSDLIEVI